MIYVHRVRARIPDNLQGLDTKVVSTVSHSDGIWSQLSPFKLGPCYLYDGHISITMENAWQYAKVYPEHWNHKAKKPKPEYYAWAREGWASPRAVRYPMGKGRVPMGSWWSDSLLDYVMARKTIYVPLYAWRAIETEAYKRLQQYYAKYKNLVLLDYDAYDHNGLGLSLTEVLNNPKQKMGHAFVLAMLLQNDPALGLTRYNEPANGVIDNGGS